MIYSCIYFARCTESNAMPCITGPVLKPTRLEALREVAEAFSDRLFDSGLLSLMEDDELILPGRGSVVSILADMENPEEMQAFMNTLSESELETLLDVYCAIESDDAMEVAYQISEHDAPGDSPNLDTFDPDMKYSFQTSPSGRTLPCTVADFRASPFASETIISIDEGFGSDSKQVYSCYQ